MGHIFRYHITNIFNMLHCLFFHSFIHSSKTFLLYCMPGLCYFLGIQIRKRQIHKLIIMPPNSLYFPQAISLILFLILNSISFVYIINYAIKINLKKTVILFLQIIVKSHYQMTVLCLQALFSMNSGEYACNVQQVVIGTHH